MSAYVSSPPSTLPTPLLRPVPTFLFFVLDDLRFALPIDQVRETVRAVAITPLAGAPGVIEGIIDVRGTVTPVLDLRSRFRLPQREITVSDHLILASAGGRQVALRVDRVLDIQTVPDKTLTTSSASEPAFAHLAGIIRLPDGLVLLNDLEAFLSQGESETLAAALIAPGVHASLVGAGDDEASPPTA